MRARFCALLVSGVVASFAAAQTVTFTPRIQTQFTKFGAAAVPRMTFVVPPHLVKAPAFAIANNHDTAGIIECSASPQDSLTVENAPNHMLVTFHCASAREVAHSNLAPHPVTFSIAYAKRVPTLHAKDEHELNTCLDSFHRYKTDPKMKVFRARFVGRFYKCDCQRNLAVTSVVRVSHALPKIQLTPLSPDSFAAKLVTGNPTSKEFYSPQKTTWVNDYAGSSGHTTEYRFGTYTSYPRPTVAALQIVGDAPMKHPAEPCTNWQSVYGLLQQQIVNVTYPNPEPPSDTTEFPAPGNKGARVYGHMTMSDQMLIALNHSKNPDSTYWIRAVPLRSAGMRKFDCVGGPSPWIRWTYHDVGKTIQQSEAEIHQAKEKYDAVFAPIKQHPQDYSPVTVHVLSYLPPKFIFSDDPYLVSTRPLTRDEFPALPADLPAGCVYDGYVVANASSYFGDPPESIWDYVVDALDDVSSAYSALQNAVVNAVAYALTGGNCGFSAGTSSDACSVLKTGLQTGMEMALAAAGIPPTIPSASQLMDQGADYLAETMVDDAVSEVPGGAFADAAIGVTRQALVDKSKEIIKNTANQLLCTYPSPPGMPPITVAGVQFTSVDSKGCLVSKGNPFTYGDRAPNLLAQPATLYIEVLPNHAPTATTFTSSFQVSVAAGNYFKPASLPVSLASLPDRGVIIPVALEPNLDFFRGPGNCNALGNSVTTTCFDEPRALEQFHDAMENQQPLNASVSTSYKWTDNIGQYKIPGFNPSDTVTITWWKDGESAMKQLGKHGRPDDPPPCPHFQYTMEFGQPVGLSVTP